MAVQQIRSGLTDLAHPGGEGLDLTGDFIYAVNVRGDGGLIVGDATFSADNVDGVIIDAQNEIAMWGDAHDFGSSVGDDNLETIMRSVRYGTFPNIVTITLMKLEVGTEYKLQLLFSEQCCARGFDVSVDNEPLVLDFAPFEEQEGISNPTAAAVVSFGKYSCSII